ncbi:hypothetical protein EH220_08125 [bacterium]|nr:MAG: hypothetical protein EH220_08125 [bacterium]
MTITLPFLTSYDPPGTSEGTLDPLGLYQIADQLAVQLVPAVRERMQRIRFLTAMAVSALVTEGLEDDLRQRDASPYLVWEWLVVEALIREMGEDRTIWGVPGTLVARRALDQHGYLDARSYLKTPRIFGFHGVYKRLASHLGLMDVHLGPGPNTQVLVDAWARGLGFAGLTGARSLLSRWSTAVRRSLDEKPARTKTGWGKQSWTELAQAFAPSAGKSREKRYLRDLLHAAEDRKLGALPKIWQLQAEFDNDGFQEESLHDMLEKRHPEYGSLIKAIRAYERFARSLQDAFDVLKAEASQLDIQGFAIGAIAGDADFKQNVKGLHESFETAHQALGEVTIANASLQNLFSERFVAFAEPMDAEGCALALCSHHEFVQRAKSAEGKRPWFDRIGQDRIYIRHAYREPRREAKPGRYVHQYRGWPIRRFYFDLYE